MRRALLCAAAVALAGCGGDKAAPEPAADPAATAMAALQANPCDAQTIALVADSVLAPLLTGVGHVENEVMDCQRLVMSTGPSGEFGPLVALFPMDSTLALPRSAFASARPAVTIYSWGPGAYPALGIEPGVRCVWLANGGDAPTGWTARVTAGAPCGAGAAAPTDSAATLPVFERVYPRTNAADYPRTARWEWDLNGAQQFIGVKCGDAWCAVVPAGAGEPRTERLVGGDDKPREAVPGWSDAQHLAVYDSATATARPGPWASLVAYQGMARDSIQWAEGILAARIRLYGAPSDPGHKRFADWFYLLPDRGVDLGELILRFPGQYDEAWYQPVPMKRRQAKRIQFAPAQPHQKGTVRWRWMETGDRIWTFCPSGTCYVDL